MEKQPEATNNLKKKLLNQCVTAQKSPNQPKTPKTKLKWQF